ncbi:hypothetical protein Nepgr_025930 [Nepenthes gracilis]|uniref:Uncharacterized protein n=1 Tax=Nepenthes gracilis TaxID=150966 RepID=A0AAD3XZY3_NEPGR|nr:hypothetical protein Nepgr_025930 [Nepenthes gracilis]
MNLNMPNTWSGWLKILYVVFAFCVALFLGAIKAILVGPVAGLILIIGNVGVILGLFPAHFAWTIYTIVNTNRFDVPLKVAILFAVPVLSALWLGLSIAGSVLLGVGYGFFAPWVSAFEAFRHDNEFKKFLHCIVDGTWDTIKGSCTVVRDFADICYHSYPLYLKEIRESPSTNELQTLRFIHIPGIVIVGLMGLIVEIPSYTVIAIVKSPYMLFRGWQRLLHDLISREGPFLETACIPIAGLTILLWPLVVVGSILMAIFSSFVVAIYGSVVAYQERSFRRGLAYVIAMVAEFDEYTNDLLYLREGTILPKPQYKKKKLSHSSELSVRDNHVRANRFSSVSTEASSIFMPTLAPSRSVRETIQEVKMVQIWGHLMHSCEARGKELIDANVIALADLSEWLKAKTGHEAAIVGIGLPSYSCLQNLLRSIKAGSDGIMLLDDVVIRNEDRPQDKLLEWFFKPLMVLKEQIQVIKLSEHEIRYLEKVVIFGSNTERMEAWENGGSMPQDPLRAAQIQGISRRLTGMMRSISKLPTYRRKFGQVVKALIAYHSEKAGTARLDPIRSASSIEIV